MDDRQNALRDFDKARNRATWQSALGFLKGVNYDLVDYNEVRKRLSKTVNALPVEKDIPIDAIVGTVSRNSDFTRTFLPKMVYDKNRWVNVRLANESLTGVPPIDVYQIGDVYFVLDGHHRVSVMKSYGAKYIAANVRIISTDVPLKSTDTVDEIIVKTEKASFISKTNIQKILPETDLEMKLPGEYPELLEHIATHKYFMGLELKRDISDEEALKDWYNQVYFPIIQEIRSQKIMDEFADKTEAELYLWIENNKAALTKEYGDKLRDSALTWKLDEEYSKSNNRWYNKLKRAIMMLFTPDLSDWGIKTGDWRKEILRASEELTIQRIMISIRDFQTDMEFLRSALQFAQQFDAWVGIVHVVKRPSMLDSEWLRKYEQRVNGMLKEEQVNGKLFILSGNLLRNLSERAFWSDISLFKMNYRPYPNGNKSIVSGWNSIIIRVPGSIFVTPDVFPTRIDHIVLLFSASPKSREALYFCTGLVKSTGSKLTVITAGGAGIDGEKAMAEAKEYLSTHQIPIDAKVYDTEPGVAIQSVTRETSADLIVMGGYSRSFIARLFKGSNVEKVLGKTEIPVIICK